MNFNVEIKIRVDGIGIIQFNEFNGKEKLVERIHKWIYEVHKQYGYREMVIEKILVNNEDKTNEIAPT